MTKENLKLFISFFFSIYNSIKHAWKLQDKWKKSNKIKLLFLYFVWSFVIRNRLKVMQLEVFTFTVSFASRR